jgi:predicted PurR-regulated permease PerM
MSNESSGIFSYIDQEKPESNRPSRVPRALAIGASIVIILAGIQAASGLLGPLLLALFIAIVLLVPLHWLQKRGCPKFLAFLIVLFCTIALFVIITYFVSTSLNRFIGEIPAYKDRVVKKYNEIDDLVKKWWFRFGEGEKKPSEQSDQTTDEPAVPVVPKSATNGATTGQQPTALQGQGILAQGNALGHGDASATSRPVRAREEGEDSESQGVALGYDTSPLQGDSNMDAIGEEQEPEDPTVEDDDIPAPSPEEVERFLKQAKELEELPSLIALDPQNVALWVAKAMQYVQKMLEGGFLVLLFTIFMLFEASYFPATVNRAFSKDSPINIEHFQRIADDVRRYLILKTVANLMSGGAAMFVYWMFGIETWFFWGIVAFVMYYIPNLGGTLAAIIPGIIILVTKDISMVLLYALCLLTIECTIAYGIEPKILGHGLRLSTMVIILSLFFWGFLLGAIGLFLAAPLTVMIKIVLQAFPETRWIAIFLEGGREKH